MLKGKLNVNLEALEGLFKPKTPPLIGTDISTSAVKMVEISEAGKGVFRVERYAVDDITGAYLDPRRPGWFPTKPAY